MKDTFYFPHDYNASQDSKMLYLLSQCGVAGVGMYWILIEILHQQTDCSISYEAYKTHIKMYYSLTNSTLEQMLNTEKILLSSGLLQHDKDGNGRVYSDRVKTNKMHREAVRNARSEAGKLSAIKRVRTNAQQTVNSPCSTKERKGKEIKEHNNGESNQPTAGGPADPKQRNLSPAQQAYKLFLDRYQEVAGIEYIATWGKHCKLLMPVVKAMDQEAYADTLENYFKSNIGADKKFSFDFFIASINTFRPVNV